MLPSATSHCQPGEAAWRLRLAGALLAGALALLVSHGALRHTCLTADEDSYLFQAHCLLDGVVARPLPPMHPVFEHKMIIMQTPVGWLSRYSPGHGLWLLPGVALGVPRLMSALAAALSAWFLTACGCRLGLRPGIILALLLCSPYFLVMHGTLLSHTSAHLGSVIVVWSYLAWQDGRRWPRALACGLAWGGLFLIRSYTAILVGLPLAAHAACQALARRDRPALAGLLAGGAGALAGVGGLLLYNYLALGNPLQTPYLYYNPLEALGFGWREMFGTTDEYTLAIGLRRTWQHLLLLDQWLWGFRGGLAAAAILLLIGGLTTWSLLPAAGAAAIWLGHLFFPSTTLNNIGPYYFFESLPLLILAATPGAQRLWQASSRWPPRLRRAAAAAALLALGGQALHFSLRQGAALRSDLAYDWRVRRTLLAAPTNALVFLDGIRSHFQNPCYNPRGLASQPLVAIYHPQDHVNLAVAKCFPDRIPLVMRAGAEERLDPFDRHRPLDINTPAELCGGYTGRPESAPDGGICRVAREGRDGAHWLAGRHYIWVSPGRFSLGFEIACNRVPADRPVTLDAISVPDGRVLASRQVHGSLPFGRLTLVLETSANQLLEQRVHYGGAGELGLKSLQLRELPARSSP